MHSVARILCQRIQGKKDNNVLALVVGGGAMRGVVSMGMLAALEAMGAGNVFDVIYGASAGAANAASFLSRQCHAHILAYAQEIASRRFIRMTRRGLFVDVRFAQKIMIEKYGLDLERVRAHRTNLHIAVTEVVTGKGAWLHTHDRINIAEALVASAALPAFYNKPVVVNGCSYLDGGITDPLPIRQAIADGATHVLVCSTVPSTHRPSMPNSMLERWVQRRVRVHGTAFLRALRARQGVYLQSLDLAFGRVSTESVIIHTVAPDMLIASFERNRRRLLEAGWHGFSKLTEAFHRAQNI